MTQERAYNYSFAELIDRLSVITQKEIYEASADKSKSYYEERKNILHDLNVMVSEKPIDAETIHAIMLLQLCNSHIWENESSARGDGENANFLHTHRLNADRAEIKRHIQEMRGGRIDHKLNYIDGVWKIKW